MYEPTIARCADIIGVHLKFISIHPTFLGFIVCLMSILLPFIRVLLELISIHLQLQFISSSGRTRGDCSLRWQDAPSYAFLEYIFKKPIFYNSLFFCDNLAGNSLFGRLIVNFLRKSPLFDIFSVAIFCLPDCKTRQRCKFG